ncbi:proline dehydrogenase [Kribbella italica]|uniref:Proline dehydrogenase n=1 Tax=Kribbella italica TaxID=1540520 RepID=A0A7W9JG88_9ACTN|nr:proline dehydrogenase [Kribbella italica]
MSFDLFGTSARDEVEVRRTLDGYIALAKASTDISPDPWISVDLSHLGLRRSRHDSVRAAMRLADYVGAGGRIQVGAEEAPLAGEVLTAVRALASEGVPVMATVQANLRRSPGDIQDLIAAGIPIRLVKGAFPERENIALAPGPAVDRAFHRLACSIHDAGGVVALATHDGALREAVFAECGQLDCEVSFGVRGEDVAGLIADGVSTRVYLPFGPQWLRFYLRRLAEAP